VLISALFLVITPFRSELCRRRFGDIVSYSIRPVRQTPLGSHFALKMEAVIIPETSAIKSLLHDTISQIQRILHNSATHSREGGVNITPCRTLM
jgi:hypothetical protein